MKKFHIIFLFLIVIFCACKKNDSIKGIPNPTVKGSVSGLVTDLNNIAISNAKVTAGTYATNTDATGKFSLQNVQLSANDGFIEVTKDGYFTGSRTFFVNSNTVNNVKIQLIDKTISGTFASSSGGNVNIKGGGSVNFSAASVVNASTGSTYSGDVLTSAFFLNPTDVNFSTYMPGDLRGLDANNKEAILKSFGMAIVEMNDASGNKLQLAPGKTASITLPIPSSLQASAPATIPLWYFDETKGTWKQEGTAAKQGTNYTGTVAHFSFWTAGQLTQDVKLQATFIDSGGNVLANKLVTIASANNGTTNGYTDNAGTVSGLVPANETLVMKAFDDCGGLVFQQNIGPFSTDTTLSSLRVSGSNPSLLAYTVTGTVVNCSNAPVSNGSVQLIIGSDQYNTPVSNGNFSITLHRCSNLSTTATISSYDSVAAQPGTAQVITISPGGGSVNAGQIIACAPVSQDQYITMTMNGNTYSWAPPRTVSANRFIDTTTNTDYITHLVGGDAQETSDSSTYFLGTMYHDNASPGNYPFYLYTIINGTQGYNTYSSAGNATVAEYGTVGGYITGSASGWLKNIQVFSDSLPFTCSYRVKRIQ
jgi:hypothetical protein